MKRLRTEDRNNPEYFDKHVLGRIKRDSALNLADDIRFGQMTKYFKGGKFLDLGCGDSPVGINLKKTYIDSEFYAIDYAPQLIDFLKREYPQIKYTCGDVLDMPYENHFFDYIISGETMEHMENIEDYLKEIFRVLKPGGIFSVSVPHKEDLTQYGTVDFAHLWSFELEDMKELMGKYGEVRAYICDKERYNKIIAWCKYTYIHYYGTDKTHSRSK